jgi:hypothetical protein
MGFFGGALGGFAKTASERKDSGKSGLLSKLRKKKGTLSSGGDESPSDTDSLGVQNARKGGRVKKGGLFHLHAGEKITPKRKRARSGKRR